MGFSSVSRQAMIDQLKHDELDVLIIGGGITGAGVALQASASGLQTGLIEMQDFAEGTSSRSTKLVHGGIRYLKNFDVEVVSDTVTERAVVQGIAPHIPKPAPMLLPIYDEPSATFNMFSVKVAMDLYDQLANVTGKYANKTLTKQEVLAREPGLKSEGLLGAGVYLDFKNNDARLVIENIKQAAADGGKMLSRVKAVGFIYDDHEQISGVVAEDLLTGEHFEIKAKIVINTAGPWVDKIRHLSHQAEAKTHMRPTKGVHLVIDEKRLKVPQPTYLDTGKNDGRMFFVVPRGKKTYFGTTDTDYQGDYAHPKVTKADVDYLLDLVNNRYPEAKITLADIESSWCGLRPLIATNGGSDYNGGNNGKVSDKSFDQVIDIVADYQHNKASRTDVETVLKNLESSVSETEGNPSAISRGSDLSKGPDGLLTLSGGKITDYRKMAEGAMIVIIHLLNEKFGGNFTLIDSKTYQVSGGKMDPTQVEETLELLANEGVEKGLTSSEAEYLADLYGTNVTVLYDYLPDFKGYEGLSLGESLSLKYAMAEEMTLTAVDFFLRRTNHLLFMRDSLDDLIEPVLQGMSDYHQWSATQLAAEKEALLATIAESDLSNLKGVNS